VVTTTAPAAPPLPHAHTWQITLASAVPAGACALVGLALAVADVQFTPRTVPNGAWRLALTYVEMAAAVWLLIFWPTQKAAGLLWPTVGSVLGVLPSWLMAWWMIEYRSGPALVGLWELAGLMALALGGKALVQARPRWQPAVLVAGAGLLVGLPAAAYLQAEFASTWAKGWYDYVPLLALLRSSTTTAPAYTWPPLAGLVLGALLIFYSRYLSRVQEAPSP